MTQLDSQNDKCQDDIVKTPIKINRNKTYKSYWNLLLIASMFQLTFVYFGYVFIYFNSLKFQQLVQIFKISLPKHIAEGIYSAIPSLGACIGSFISRFFIKRYSRRYLFDDQNFRQNYILCNILTVLAGILVMIPNMTTLLFGRILQGICVGYFCSLTPLIIKQLSPIQILGNLSGLNQIGIALGFVIGYVLGWISNTIFINPIYKYILVFGFNFVFSFINLIWIMFVFPHETPKYLIQNRRIDQARQIIEKVYKEEYQQIILKQKILQYESKCFSIPNQHQKAQGNQELIIKSSQMKQYQSSWLALVSGLFLGITQQMSGCNVLPIFAPQIAHKYFPSIAGKFTMFINLQKLVIATLATFFILNKFKRKKLILLGTGLCAITLYCFLYGIYKVRYQQKNGQIFILVGYVAYMFVFPATLGPLTWLYISEVVQPNEISYIIFAKWVTSFISVLLFPIVRQHTQTKDGGQFFVVSFIFTTLACFILYYLCVETKDKNEIQIRQQIQQKQDYFENMF